MKSTLGIFGLLAASAGGWVGYRALFGEGSPTRYVTVAVDRGTIVSTVSATGTIEPTTKVLVGSQVSGTVTRWYTDFNQPVRKDEVLLELDQDRFKTALAQREAALKVAQARLQEARVRHADAERERNRMKALFERRAASENEFQVVCAVEEQAAAVVRAAEAECDSAVAERDAAAVELSRTVIRSPIDGMVISRDVDEGQTVAASLQAPTLFTIAADLRTMQVDANVAESDVGRIREGMPAEFTVDAYPGRRFRGVVRQVRFNPTIVDNIVTYVTIVDVDNRDLLLRPGMTANVSFEVARADDVLRVPNAALRFTPEDPLSLGSVPVGAPTTGPRQPTVHLLAEGEPRPVEVELGLTDGSFTELRKPTLAAGDSVIIERRWDSAMGSRQPGPPRGGTPRGAMRRL